MQIWKVADGGSHPRPFSRAATSSAPPQSAPGGYREPEESADPLTSKHEPAPITHAPVIEPVLELEYRFPVPGLRHMTRAALRVLYCDSCNSQGHYLSTSLFHGFLVSRSFTVPFAVVVWASAEATHHEADGEAFIQTAKQLRSFLMLKLL